MSDKTFIDPVEGLEVRATDNGVKDGDPEQPTEQVAAPLNLDENGIPYLEQEA